MTEEKQGAAEWLRGIIEEYEANGEMGGCSAMAKMFGVNCEDVTCRGCMIKMMTAIADRIDAERALLEGVEWPRFEDGEPVKVGDDVDYGEETMWVRSVTFVANGWSLRCERRGVDGVLYGLFGERVKRPAPEVLGADGEPIEVGDTVWGTYDGCKHVVKAVCSDGSLRPNLLMKDGCMVEYEEGGWDFAKKVTHKRPDSWERLEEDAAKGGSEYARDILGADVRRTTTSEDYEAFARDIVRRAKELAKAGEFE